MVIIDPGQRESGIPTDAYFAVEEIKDVGGFRLFCIPMCARPESESTTLYCK